MTENLPAPRGPWARELIQNIALDIGKDVAAHIETMYPDAVKAASSTFLLSVRNHTFNQIMAAIEVNDEGQILDRLAERKKHRRDMRAVWKKIRDTAPVPNGERASGA